MYWCSVCESGSMRRSESVIVGVCFYVKESVYVCWCEVIVCECDSACVGVKIVRMSKCVYMYACVCKVKHWNICSYILTLSLSILTSLSHFHLILSHTRSLNTL